MKAVARIYWQSRDKAKSGTIEVKGEGIALRDTIVNMSDAIVEALDAAPDEKLMGWYQAQVIVDRGEA